MKKLVNGKVVEFTAEEIAARQKEVTMKSLMERTRPMTAEEVSRMLLTQQVNTLEVDDNTALRMKAFYPEFKDIVGQKVKKGFKFTHDDKLWSVVQPELVIQSHYPPGAGMESLYTEVCDTHAGTLDDPIPYSGNMALEEGKYYYQEFVIYRCIRSTGQPVYHRLEELGSYVEKV